MSRLSGKAALVTGGAHGIGRATCLLLAREGAMVAVTDVLDDEGAEVVKEIRRRGGNARYWHLDVSDEDNVRLVVKEVAEMFGRLDVLVNNAGIGGPARPTHELTEDEWDRVMDVNVKGAFLCTKHAIRWMRQNGGGSIVNLSSVHGKPGLDDGPQYYASKGALGSMTKTDAIVYAKDGVRVNSVHPGLIWTPWIERALRRTGDVKQGKKALDQMQPIGAMGEPEDVAYGILYLASEESKFVTGSELVIDGGYTAR